MTIPANTEGVIHLPARQVNGISKQGKPLSQVAGIREIQQQEETVVVTVGSGAYQFSVKIA